MSDEDSLHLSPTPFIFSVFLFLSHSLPLSVSLCFPFLHLSSQITSPRSHLVSSALSLFVDLLQQPPSLFACSFSLPLILIGHSIHFSLLQCVLGVMVTLVLSPQAAFISAGLRGAHTLAGMHAHTHLKILTRSSGGGLISLG